MMDALDQSLLNDYQHSFPLVSKPFDHLAQCLDSDTDIVIDRMRSLSENGTISRIGPVFKPNTVGVSTLAAMSVPATMLEYYAQIVNRFDEVNHNYEREHEINLWFVLTAENQSALDTTIAEIEDQTGQTILVLPMLKEYHIDLGFSLHQFDKRQRCTRKVTLKKQASCEPLKHFELFDAKTLIAAVQGGLPLVEKPYQVIAEQMGCMEQNVIEGLKRLIQNGAIKRFGVVVRHHEVGYRANAMVVWNVQDKIVDQLGEQLGNEPCVTLCYLRPRVLPRWSYNLFCMIHGKSREEVVASINKIREQHGLEDFNHQVLFSGKRFKQRGAHYYHRQKQAGVA